MLVALFGLSAANLVAAEKSKAIDASEQQQVSRVYFSLEDKATAPSRDAVSQFDCTDKIYTVLELQGYPLGRYALSVKWVDPAGEQREHTQYPFNIHNKDEHRLWAWLSLSRARGAGMLTFINPAAGLEEFIGEWEIEVRLDGKLIDSKNFDVIC